ncbi:MAG TPA: hydantoinase/oxoprolinase family protein [Pyrinomonadaceae bacterium]|nr:hydantoinase/oxoprolinase family protein [Pyrinomonadaceae bacterium]
MYSLGIDVGGTFTDVVIVDEKNEVEMMKIPSTPENPLEGIKNGLKEIARVVGRGEEDLIKSTERFVHGTTVATNTMLEYKGAKTALLTTLGFRDSLEMRRCHRNGQWDFFTPQPPIIVPRFLRRGIKERTLWDGSIDQPLDEDLLRSELKELVEKHEVGAIAICFLFSFKNPENERRAAEIIRRTYPNIFVSASSEVAPQIREYERTCTTVVNAFVGPGLSNYLSELGGYLERKGMNREFQVIQSNGGVTTASAAGQHGVRALLSGPAGGAIGGASLAEAIAEPNLIIADMGGTSFDLTLVQNKQVSLVTEEEVAGYKISLPMIGIYTVGAGGGSIGQLDAGGILKVGPRSAGANPGPACYDRGGSEATVTDANLALGFLNPAYFLGGSMPLNPALAAKAIEENVARPLGISTTEAAQAIYEIVNSNMVDAIHVVTVEQGYDPREFALVAAGGAAPLHTGVLAKALGIPRVIVPHASAVFCALGGLEADMKYDYVRTYLAKMGTLESEQLFKAFGELRQEGIARLEKDGIAENMRFFEYWLEMRYVGQHWDIPVPVSMGNGNKPRLADIVQEFHKRHELVHGYKLEEREVEIANLRLMAIGKSPKLKLKTRPFEGKDAAPALKDRRRAYFGTETGFLEVPIYDGSKLRSGNEFSGPAIIEKPSTTIVVYPEQHARVDEWENMIVEIQ